MATKKITKSGTYNITVNAKSKDTVYQFSNQTIATGAFLNFTFTDSLDRQYARKGNDLIIFAEFGSSNNYTPVITTVKDYYKYAWDYNNDLVSINSTSIYNDGAIYNLTNRYAKGNIIDDSAPLTYIGDRSNTTYNFKYSSGNIIYETAGNDTYNMWNNATIYDYSGKDKYKIQKSAKISTLADYKGNDEYSFTSDHYSNVHDYNGNDKYTFTNAVMVTTGDDPNANRINDYSGNDTYKVTKSKGIYIDDRKGNDKYTVSNCEDLVYSSSPQNLYIYDREGNDSYNLSNVSYTSINVGVNNIYDEKGKDTYNLNAVKNMTILDGAGKDTYIVTNSNHLYLEEAYEQTSDNDTFKIYDSSNISINEKGGNETYTFKALNNSTVTDSLGDDKYNLSDESKYVMIEDLAGKDTYNFNGTINCEITETKGNDTYNIKNSDKVVVTDSLGDDTYNYTNVYSTSISSLDSTITDNGGKDTYNIASSELKITDSEGNDTYNLNNNISVQINDTNTSSNDTYKFTKISGMTSIVDGGGSNDKLVMSKANAKNVVYLADFTTDNKINSTKLFIFDKTSEGIIEIKDYFNVSESAITGTTGSGKIESIKAGKTEFVSKIDNFYGTSTNYTQLASDVASWLSTNTGCTNLGDLVNDGSQSQIQDFIAYFSNK